MNKLLSIFTVFVIGFAQPASAKKEEVDLYFCNLTAQPVSFRYHQGSERLTPKKTYLGACRCNEPYRMYKGVKKVENEKVHAKVYQAVYRGVGKEKHTEFSACFSASGDITGFAEVGGEACAKTGSTTTFEAAPEITDPLGNVKVLDPSLMPQAHGANLVYRYSGTGGLTCKKVSDAKANVNGKPLSDYLDI